MPDLTHLVMRRASRLVKCVAMLFIWNQTTPLQSGAARPRHLIQAASRFERGCVRSPPHDAFSCEPLWSLANSGSQRRLAPSGSWVGLPWADCCCPRPGSPEADCPILLPASTERPIRPPCLSSLVVVGVVDVLFATASGFAPHPPRHPSQRRLPEARAVLAARRTTPDPARLATARAGHASRGRAQIVASAACMLATGPKKRPLSRDRPTADFVEILETNSVGLTTCARTSLPDWEIQPAAPPHEPPAPFPWTQEPLEAAADLGSYLGAHQGRNLAQPSTRDPGAARRCTP